MDSMKMFLEIVEVGKSKSGRTRVWQVINLRTREMAGEIRYRYGCHGYVFYPSNDFFFNASCMLQVGEHLARWSNTKKPRVIHSPTTTSCASQVQ